MRILWVIAGLVCVGLGLIGIVLPLVPTVPFMLLAAFCFARSSERLHGWLLTHPRFGAAIADWQERGAISPRVKRISSVSILAVFGLSVVLGLRPLVIGIQAVVLGGVMIFIWSRPNW